MELVGKWVDGVHLTYSIAWKWFWDEETKLPYRLVDNIWQQFHPIVIRRNTRSTVDRFRNYNQIPDPPNVQQS